MAKKAKKAQCQQKMLRCWPTFSALGGCLAERIMNVLIRLWSLVKPTQVLWINYYLNCTLLRNYAYLFDVSLFILMPISCISFSPGSAKARIGWGENLNDHFIASCVRNIRTKIIKIW